MMTEPLIEVMGTEMDGLLDGGEKGIVHSVFSSALNIKLDSGRLVTVLSAGRSPQPYSLSLSGRIRFDHIGLSSGDQAKLGPDGLEAGGLKARISPHTNRVNLSLAGSVGLSVPARYEVRLSILASAIDKTGAQDGLAPVLCALAPERIPFIMEQNVYTSFLIDRIKKLGALLPDGDLDEIKAAGGELAGCGAGLTPSSDDFICGVMASLYGAAESGILRVQRTREVCTALSEGAAPKTGDISAAFLRNSGEGLFGQDVLSLLRAFFSGDELELGRAARELSAFGSTSGCDILTGIWFQLSALKPDA